jgi:thiol-disulfide isomerase/thioredoxin
MALCNLYRYHQETREEVLMKCPKCQETAPDNNYKCPHCGEVLIPDFEFHQSHPVSADKKSPMLTYSILIIMVVGLLIIGYLMMGRKSQNTIPMNSRDSNLMGFQPGEMTDIKELIQPGKTTIFDFYSDYCGPCKRISPRLQKLDQMREDIVVVKININRKNVRGIDWNSPLARQYNLSSIPYFMVYDSQGNQTHEGSTAWRLIYQLLNEAGV